MATNLNTASEVRSLLASLGFAKVGVTKSVQGRWTKGGETIHVGMGLSPKFRTGQSTQGGGEWVYTVSAPVRSERKCAAEQNGEVA